MLQEAIFFFSLPIPTHTQRQKEDERNTQCKVHQTHNRLVAIHLPFAPPFEVGVTSRNTRCPWCNSACLSRDPATRRALTR